MKLKKLSFVSYFFNVCFFSTSINSSFDDSSHLSQIYKETRDGNVKSCHDEF